MEKLSVCIITKNEEANIFDCINSVREIASQIIVLDTGSSDNTIKIAKDYAEVYSFNWINDFSAARNKSLEYARYDWILVLDADERVINLNDWFVTINEANPKVGGILCNIVSIKGTNRSISTVLRLFRNDKRFKFKGIIHEQIAASIIDSGLVLAHSNLEILHLGYDISREALEQKYNRNLALINDWLLLHPEDIYTSLHKGKMLIGLGKLQEGIEVLEKLIKEINHDNVATKIETLNYISETAIKLNDINKVIDYSKQSLLLDNNQVISNMLLVNAYFMQNNYSDAIEYYTTALKNTTIKEKNKVILGKVLIPKEQIHWKLGQTFLAMDDLQKATDEFSDGLLISPKDMNCLIGFANVAVKLNKFDVAINMLKETYKLHPNNNEILDFIKQTENIKADFLITKKNVNVTEFHPLNTEKVVPLISLCMIVKNEEKMLSGCLESIKNVVDEIIIVDTGSTDNTIEIAKKYNAKIFYYEWNNDFAKARNESLKNATGKWILYLDADERLNKNSQSIIQQLLSTAGQEIGAYLCTIESEHRKLDNSSEKHTGAYPRLFRNYIYPNIKFIGRVHEQIAPAIIEMKKNIVFSDIVIEHLGYNLSEADMNNKVKRNYKLLLENVNEEPTNGYAWFQLGQTLGQMQLYEEALNATEFALKCDNLSEPVLASATNTIAQLYGRKKNYEKALYWANESLNLVPQQLFGVSLKAHSLLYLGQKEEAEQTFIEALKLFKNRPHNTKIGVDIDISEEILLKGLSESQKR